MTASSPDAKASGTGLLGLVALVVIIWFVFFRGGDADSSSERSAPAETNTNITGRFISWEPVDDARGYASFSVTNHGSAAAEATCTVRVSNDFGNFGFDYMVGETIGAGDTRNFRMALNVDEGSFLINEGEVTDC
jgi:hypothetical protein